MPDAAKGNCLLARPGCAAIRPAIPGGAAGLRRVQHAQTGHPAYRANLSVQPCKGNRMASEASLNADLEDGVRRRDFINIDPFLFAGVGAATVVVAVGSTHVITPDT